MTRRDLLRGAAMGSAMMLRAGASFAAVTPSMIGVPFSATANVRFGVIGAGGRGKNMMHEMLALDNAEIRAICDVNRDEALTAQAFVEKAGGKKPVVYTAGEHDFENLVKRDDLDFIYVATPWNWHVPMAVAALRAGKHVGVEVPVATTLDGCWEIVNESEKNRRHCMIMENCCYGYNAMLVLNMIRDNMLGDLVHGEAAYIHDLREELLSNRGEGLWRWKPHTTENGNLYPTHGLGPVANYMGVNRGDRFEYLVSVSSLQKGLEQYRDAHPQTDEAKRTAKFIEGDMNTSVIRTANGRTIMLQHDVVNARPYDRINLISGTKGVFRDYPARVYLDGQPGKEEFISIDALKPKYEDRLWKTYGEKAKSLGGHDGIDFIMLSRLVECFNKGLVPDMDVYDAASWSAPAPLSEQSVANGSAPVKFPDFTRGRWTEKRGWLA